jgi:hypothetical protein
MKGILLILALTFILSKGYSQQEKFIIKFCPLSLVDEVTFPTIQGGLEAWLSKRYSWYNEIGIKYRRGYYESPDTSFLTSYGFKIKTEFRYYFPDKFGFKNTNGQMKGFYVGINAFYIRDCHNSWLDYYLNKDNSNLISDSFAVKKNVFGANYVIGVQETIWKNFLIDVYAGVGFRLRIIDNIHREYDPDRDTKEEPVDVTIQGIRDNIDVMEGLSGMINLTFGFRLCYKL